MTLLGCFAFMALLGFAMAAPITVEDSTSKRRECHGTCGGDMEVSWNVDGTQAKLQEKQRQIFEIKRVLEQQWIAFDSAKPRLNGAGNGTCFGADGLVPGKSLDGCGNSLPSSLSPICSAFLGDTKGCECNGKNVVQKTAVKALDPVLDPNSHLRAAVVACFAAGPPMDAAYRKSSGQADYENKLMYFGSVDGVIAYYPGVLWARSVDSRGEKTCGADYDPRKRPWFLTGSNGPKNVIFILDSSGSMQKPVHHPRMQLLKTAAKSIMDGLTNSDFVAIVDFDKEAKTYQDNKFMGRAASGFRQEMNSFIDGLDADGGTAYVTAFERAFQVADNAYSTKYESNCQTVFVFLTDGESEQDPTAIISQRKQRLNRVEMYFIIGLGNDVKPDTDAGKKLQQIACASGGILESVADVEQNQGVAGARVAEAKLKDALSSFSRYFQTVNAKTRREVVSYSEIYEGANFPMRMTTAAVPIYDKRDSSRWKFLGVAGIDVTTCDIERQLVAANPTIQNCPPEPRDSLVDKCKCASEWEYKGKKYQGCTKLDWPYEWCATEGCGIPLDTTSTGYWADCKPFGASAVLEDMLMQSGEECSLRPLEAAALQALRPPEFQCDITVDASALQAEKSSNFHNGLPAANITSLSAGTADWAQNSGGVWSETEWSTDTQGCDQCKSTNMQPACAKPSTCPEAKEGIPELQICFSPASRLLPGMPAALASFVVLASWLPQGFLPFH